MNGRRKNLEYNKMDKLKTLKDIQLNPKVNSPEELDWAVLRANGTDMQKNNLKKEAIKWIKYEELILLDYPISACEMMPAQDYLDMIRKQHKRYPTEQKKQIKICVEWIKHFFNISEEDLK
jgi:hypothetical protein